MDHTADPRASGLINQCFTTTKEAIFFSGKCGPTGTWTYCDTVISLNPHPDPRWKFPQFPPTLQAYRDDPVYWSGRIHEAEKSRQGSQIQRDRLVIYGGLPDGTALQIVQMLRWFNGENGTFWLGYAVIQSGDFRGRRVLLPWDGSGDLPWLIPIPGPNGLPSKSPMPDPHYLTSCAGNTIGAATAVPEKPP